MRSACRFKRLKARLVYLLLIACMPWMITTFDLGKLRLVQKFGYDEYIKKIILLQVIAIFNIVTDTFTGKTNSIKINFLLTLIY